MDLLLNKALSLMTLVYKKAILHWAIMLCAWEVQ